MPAANAAHQKHDDGHEEPSPEPRRSGHRPRQEVVEPAARLLRTRRGDLAGGDEGDQDRQMRKHTPSTASAPVPVAPSLENTSLTDDPRSWRRPISR